MFRVNTEEKTLKELYGEESEWCDCLLKLITIYQSDSYYTTITTTRTGKTSSSSRETIKEKLERLENDEKFIYELLKCICLKQYREVCKIPTMEAVEKGKYRVSTIMKYSKDEMKGLFTLLNRKGLLTNSLRGLFGKKNEYIDILLEVLLQFESLFVIDYTSDESIKQCLAALDTNRNLMFHFASAVYYSREGKHLPTSLKTEDFSNSCKAQTLTSLMKYRKKGWKGLFDNFIQCTEQRKVSSAIEELIAIASAIEENEHKNDLGSLLVLLKNVNKLLTPLEHISEEVTRFKESLTRIKEQVDEANDGIAILYGLAAKSHLEQKYEHDNVNCPHHITKLVGLQETRPNWQKDLDLLVKNKHVLDEHAELLSLNTNEVECYFLLEQRTDARNCRIIEIAAYSFEKEKKILVKLIQLEREVLAFSYKHGRSLVEIGFITPAYVTINNILEVINKFDNQFDFSLVKQYLEEGKFNVIKTSTSR